MRLEHPIFTTPLTPRIPLHDTKTPEHYARSTFGKVLTPTMKTWAVQVGELRKEVDYGLVSEPFGFEDSPDAEVISSGINSKSATSVALGRHANLFLWGFGGDPTQMTESARQVFVNAVCWMKRFDGAPMLVRKEPGSQSRDWAQIWPTVILRLEQRSRDANRDREMLRENFDESLRGKGDGDFEKVLATVVANREMLHKDRGRWSVDQDLVALGIGNRDPRLLEALASRLREDDADALARRLLARYVPDAAKLGAASYRQWLDQRQGKLFFSDVGGFRWFVNENAPR